MKAFLFGLLGLVSTILALPTDLSPQNLPVWQYYIDATSAQHQTNFNKWTALGYRMISLSAYGQPPNHRYAVVWVQRSGPSYWAIHEASGSTYQSWFDTHAAAGYVSTIITVTGPESAPVFAGVMEQNGVSSWYQKCGLTQSQYSTELNNAQTNNFILKSFTEYGSSSDRRFCGLWYANSQYDKYTTFIDESYGDYQTTFNSEVTKPYWRPSYLSVSEDHLVSSTFTDTDVGSWLARHGLTAATLQTEVSAQTAAGRYLVELTGGGTGSSTNFAAIFAEHDIPTPRTWGVAGTVTGFQNNGAAQTSADAMIQNFMKANGVRQAQLTIGKNGNILLQKAYSWSENTRHTTAASDVFLLASLSKMYVSLFIVLSPSR